MVGTIYNISPNTMMQYTVPLKSPRRYLMEEECQKLFPQLNLK